MCADVNVTPAWALRSSTTVVRSAKSACLPSFALAFLEFVLGHWRFGFAKRRVPSPQTLEGRRRLAGQPRLGRSRGQAFQERFRIGTIHVLKRFDGAYGANFVGQPVG